MLPSHPPRHPNPHRSGGGIRLRSTSGEAAGEQSNLGAARGSSVWRGVGERCGSTKEMDKDGGSGGSLGTDRQQDLWKSSQRSLLPAMYLCTNSSAVPPNPFLGLFIFNCFLMDDD